MFSGGDSSKFYGADEQRLQIFGFRFDKFPAPVTFVCWKMGFKIQVCISRPSPPQFPTEAMLFIKKKMELLGSVDELKSSSFTRDISMKNFEVLVARITSARNKIIHNTEVKSLVSFDGMTAQKKIFPKKQIVDLRVLLHHRSQHFCWYAVLFDIQEFDSKCDGILLQIDETSIW